MMNITNMKKVTSVMLLSIWMIGSTMAANSGEAVRSVKEVMVNISLDNATLLEAFGQVESQTDFTFHYSQADLSKTVQINKRYKSVSVADVLIDISKEANLKFKQVNNNISVNVVPETEAGKNEGIVIALADITVKGAVTDENGEGLPGVSIKVQGTSTGTVTDFNGAYTLNVDENATLVFRYIGYSEQIVAIGGRSTINISLAPDAEQLAEVMIIGSRNANRTALETAVPVDVIDVEAMGITNPQISVNQILNYAAPSFTSNTQTVSDGTDHIDPASLRGLGPDQVLVLINGKRRHTSSLVNVNGTVGTGNVGTDLNAIPAASIKRIEVLRDGAAAQYGSDAIAGVINIVLKDNVDQLSVVINSGANTGANADGYGVGGVDGETFQMDINYGLPIGNKGGYINFTGNFTNREGTIRSDEMGKDIFLGYNAVETIANNDGYDLSELQFNDQQIKDYAQGVTHFSQSLKDDIAAAPDRATLVDLLDDDVTDAELGVRDMTRKDFRMKIGQSKIEGGQFFMNMAIPVGDGGEIYAFGGIGYRRGLGAGFYRRPAYTDGRGNTPAFMNGFLPHIGSNIKDKSLAMGIKGKIGDWKSDFSNTWGSNSFTFNIVNTSNSTLGKSTNREFDAGGFQFIQNTTNWDISKYHDDIMSGLNVAFGAEYRVENYKLLAGEEASYTTYDIYGNPINSQTPDNDKVQSFYGKNIPGGSQVFPGYRPDNTADGFRTSYATYLDLEADVIDNWMVAVALRYENYSDFGSTLNWKLASRYSITDNFAIRGAASTGFRAPSLHQIYFNATATQFIGGEPFEVGTFANNSRAADLFGIPKLKSETAQNFSLGFTANLMDGALSITVDGYLINIEDRVIITGNFSKPDQADDPELYAIFESAGANKAKFFTNGIDTESKGIDIVISHKMNVGSGALTNNLSASFQQTNQVGDLNISDELVGREEEFFGSTSKGYLETAMPRQKINLSHFLTFDKFSFMLRNVYFGEVIDPDNKAVYAGKIITDISVSYAVMKNLRFTVGANNLLDIYPDENLEESNYGRQFMYSRRVSQFGFNGRYVFARVAFTL